MNCLEFERLLDGGEPRRLPAAASAHARECARCDRSLARARSLERALERHFASTADASAEAVLAGFTERVLARVASGEARGVRWLVLPDVLPWWVRAAAEPGVLLAGVVAALLLWRPEALIATARAWFPVAAAAPTNLAAALRGSEWEAFGRALSQALVPGAGAHWAVSVGTALGVAPLFALAAFALWRASERVVGRVGGLRAS